MNTYEQKQAARRARLESAAERAKREADSRFRRANESVAGIPAGQPILVGHHSEKRHRRDLERHDSNMRAGIAANKRAGDLAAKAAAVGTAGISSDNPDAIDELRSQLTELETKQARMVATNKLVRKGDRTGLANMGYSEGVIDALFTPDFIGRCGFADYQMKNNGANIRRIKARIAELEAKRGKETIERIINGVRVVENVEENRLQLFFDGKPPADVRAKLKGHGFRWAPSEGAWQRHLSNSARWAASTVLEG